MRLDGRVAFVTGAAGGIGRAICEQFINEGARVAATDVDAAAVLEVISAAKPGQAIAFACDAADSESVRDGVARTVQEFGMLNVLCSVAGGSSLRDGPVTEAPEEEFWRVIGLDLFGPWVACKHGIPELIKAGGGSVILMTSMTALMGTTDRDCYTAAKGGVASMTRSIATGYAGQGVRVNAIAPGMTLTPRVMARASSPNVAALAARHLLGPAEPADVANMAVFLASDESARVTGQILRVDSGVTIH